MRFPLRITIAIISTLFAGALALGPACSGAESEPPDLPPGDTDAEPDTSAPEVRYETGRLTVHAVDAPLDGLLADIARVSGAEIRGSVPSRPVTIKLDAEPFAEALAYLLRDQSFMLTYDGSGKPRTINLIDASGGPKSRGAASASTPAPQSSGGSLAEEEKQATVLQKSVPISPTLAQSLEMDSPSTGQLMIAAMGDDRPKVRAEAREAMLSAVNFDLDIEAAYLSTLTPVSDATLVKTFRGMAKDGAAEELMEALATRARSPALRQKAASVLAKLRQTPPSPPTPH